MFPDGDRNSPPAAVCMGRSVALGAAAGTAIVGVVVTAGAEAATGLVAVATGALADDVAARDAAALGAAPAADDVLGLQADSVSPRPRPSAERPAIQAACVKCRKFSIISPYFPKRSGLTVDDGRGRLVVALDLLLRAHLKPGADPPFRGHRESAGAQCVPLGLIEVPGHHDRLNGAP